MRRRGRRYATPSVLLRAYADGGTDGFGVQNILHASALLMEAFGVAKSKGEALAQIYGKADADDVGYQRFLLDTHVAHDAEFGSSGAGTVSAVTQLPPPAVQASSSGDPARRWFGVIDAAVSELRARTGGKSNVLTYRKNRSVHVNAEKSADGWGGPDRNTSVHILAKDEQWFKLHNRVGDAVAMALLMRCAIFMPIATGEACDGVGALVQLTGHALGERWTGLPANLRRLALSAAREKPEQHAHAITSSKRAAPATTGGAATQQTPRKRRRGTDGSMASRLPDLPDVLASSGHNRRRATAVPVAGLDSGIARYQPQFRRHPGFAAAHTLNRFPATTAGGSSLLYYMVQLYTNSLNRNQSIQSRSQQHRIRRAYNGLHDVLRATLRNHQQVKRSYGQMLQKHCPLPKGDGGGGGGGNSDKEVLASPSLLANTAAPLTPSLASPHVLPKPAEAPGTAKHRDALCEKIRTLLASSTPHGAVKAFVVVVLRRLLPHGLLGSKHNMRALSNTIHRVVSLRRYESFYLHQCAHRMRISEIPWLRYDPKHSSRRASRTPTKAFQSAQRRRLSTVLYWIFTELVMPLIHGHFYSTETQTTRHRIVYYRKPVWAHLNAVFVESLGAFGGLPDVAEVFDGKQVPENAAAAFAQAAAGVHDPSEVEELAVEASSSTPPNASRRAPETPSDEQKAPRVRRELYPATALPHRRMFVRIAASRAEAMLRSHESIGVGRLRLLPKRSTLRIITNLSRQPRVSFHGPQKSVESMGKGKARKVQGKASAYARRFVHVAPVNMQLRELHAVMQYEVNRSSHARSDAHPLLGSTVLSYRDVHRRLLAYRERISADGLDGRVSFVVSVDVRSAFDSIPHEPLKKHVIDNTEVFVHDEYLGVRYTSVQPTDQAGLRVLSRVGALPIQGKQEEIVAIRALGLGFGGVVARMAFSADAQGREEGILADKRRWTRALRLRPVYVDAGKSTTLKRSALKERLRKHIMNNIVPASIGKHWYEQKCGIPQGSKLSTLLCCMFFGQMEKEERLIRPDAPGGVGIDESGPSTPPIASTTDVRCAPSPLLMRMVDDMLFVSPSRDAAVEHLRRLRAGSLREKWNCMINHAKTAISFDLENLARNEVVDGTGVRYVPWCGLLFRSDTLEVQADYARWTAEPLTSSITVVHAEPGAGLLRRMQQYIFPRMLHILYDARVNSRETILLNLFQLYLYVASKALAYISSLGSVHNIAFLHRLLIQYLPAFVYRTVRGRFNTALGERESAFLCAKAVQRVVRLKLVRSRRSPPAFLAALLRRVDQTVARAPACLPRRLGVVVDRRRSPFAERLVW